MHGPEDVLDALCGARLDRRRFLKRTAGGVALLGIGALLPAGCSRYPKPAVRLRFLDSREYAIMTAVGMRLLGQDRTIGSGTDQIHVGAGVDALVADWAGGRVRPGAAATGSAPSAASRATPNNGGAVSLLLTS